jgi:hypothetical protein
MKKLTTTMMQRTVNKQDGHLTIGLDLGDRSSFYCVLTYSLSHKKTTKICRRLPN